MPGEQFVDRSWFVLVIASVVAAALHGHAHGQAATRVVVEAVDAAKSQIVVRRAENLWTLPVSPNVRIAVDGREATLAEITSGVVADVVFDKTADAVMSVAISWSDQQPASPPEVRQLVRDGGFERITDAANVTGWERQSGHVMSSDQARAGARALRLRGAAGNDEARVFSAAKLTVKPGGTYRLSIWARGTGKLAFNVYQHDAINPIGTDFLRDQPTLELTDEWQQLRCVYRPADKRLKCAAMAVVLYGSDAEALIDDASFTFAQAENPGITLDDAAPRRDLRIAVQAFQADAELFVGGRPVKIADGVGTAPIEEGLVGVAVRATPAGARPRVRMRVIDHPEADGRWRVSDRETPGWQDVGFDDGAWAVARPDPAGFMWAQATRARVAVFRQVLLWNEAPYGPNRCILPRASEWGFSRDGVDNMLLALYSPLAFDLEGYEFVLDVPREFRLFGIDKPYYQRYLTNEVPSSVTEERVSRDGQAFTRYRIAYAAKQVPADGTRYTWLPIQLDGGEPGATTAFYFHRRGRGNFTECEQRIPVRILPPVNGRQPKRVLLSQYCPIMFATLSPRHMKALVGQAAEAGFNFATVTITQPGWGPQWIAFLKSFYDELVANGFGTIIGSPDNFPLHGSHVPGHQSDAFLRWVAATPDAQASYFDARRWNADRDNMYCPTYMLADGREQFRELVARNYAEKVARTPAASILFLDYEAHAWRDEGGADRGTSFCFCSRCKERFRERAGLARDADLSNGTIHDRHHRAWAEFHDWQVTEIQGQVKAAVNGIGLRSMIYSWAGFAPFWSQIRGKTDIAFVGLPGNGVANGVSQKMLDDEARTLRVDQRVPQVIGQRFSFLGVNEAKDGWKEVVVLSDDGFVQPKSWKSQVLRIVAALGGGVDLQNAGECVAGMQYWIGEATRIIAAHEDLFFEGERADHLASSEQIAYPDLLVLKKGQRRLVLLFNEGDAERRVTLRNAKLEPGQRARVFETADWGTAETLDVVVPAGDAIAVEIE
jgi:hypothetical protein